MRGVGDEALLRFEETGQPVGHAIERGSQVPELGWSVARDDPRVQFAFGEPVRRSLEIVHRTRQAARENETDTRRDEEHSAAQKRELEPGSVHAFVERRSRVRDANRATDATVLGDGNRRVHQGRTERLRASGSFDAPAVQRGLDLGTILRVVATGIVGAVRIEARSAARVHDHDVATGARRVLHDFETRK